MDDLASGIEGEPRKPRRVHTERAFEVRRRIILAAAREFIKKGYSGAVLSDIILDADASKATFYSLFDGENKKRTLARAIMDGALTMDGLQEQASTIQSIYDTGMVMACGMSNPVYLAALKLSFETGAEEEYGNPWRRWVVFNAKQLRKAKDENELRQHVDIDAQARNIAGMWSGTVLMALTLDQGLDEVEANVCFAYRIMMGAIASPEVLPHVDFSPDRGRKLYADFVQKEQMMRETADE